MFLAPEGRDLFMVTELYRNLVLRVFKVMMKLTFFTGSSCQVRMVLLGLSSPTVMNAGIIVSLKIAH